MMGWSSHAVKRNREREDADRKFREMLEKERAGKNQEGDE